MCLCSYDGNSFDNGPAPPPPPGTPPPAKRRHKSSGGTSQSPESPNSQASHGKKKSSHIGTIIGVAFGVVFLLLFGILLALLFCKRKRRTKNDGGRMSVRGVSNGSEKGRDLSHIMSFYLH